MDGGMAEYVKIPGVVLQRDPASIRRIPKNMPFEHAAVMDPICNAYRAIVQEARVLPGENVVIYGNGPLGLFSVLIARVINAGKIVVISTGRSATKRNPICKKLGATNLLMADDPDIVTKVKAIGGEDGIAAVINCASRSANVLPEAVEMLRPGGAFIMIGYTRVAVSYEEDPADLMAHKGITFIGHMGYDHTSWRNTLALYREGRINMEPIVTHKLPLSKWKDGFDMFNEREAAKVVLVPDLYQ
jgi:threonine dehydrogenase-like Zn-dependent dehydrogenase